MDEKKKDVHANVGFSISSTPERTEVTRPRKAPRTTRAQFPFRVVFVSDLQPEKSNIDWAGTSQLRSVDPNSLSGFLASLSPTLHLDVDNKLQLQPRKLELALEFRSFSDFKPEGIVRMVPELSSLWTIRDLVISVGKGALSASDFKKKLNALGIDEVWSDGLYETLTEENDKPRTGRAAARHEDADEKSALDSIFEMVDLGPVTASDDADDSDDAPESPATAFVAALGGSDSSHARGARQIASDIENRVSLQVQTVLDHPEFRDLEARWRGLKFLLDHLDFRADVRLDVLSVGLDDLDEALHYQIVIPEHEGDVGTPASLLVFDHAFGYGVLDVEALTEIGSVAESIQTPAIATVSPSFWGCDGAEDLGDLEVIWQHLQRPEYIEWSRFPETSGSMHVALAMPPFLLREPYDSTTAGKGLSVRETKRLWGAASVATAAIVARRFTESGWPTLLTGQGGHQLEELPLWKSGKGPIPLSAVYGSGKQGELSDSGFTVLGCLPGKDHMYLQTSPTASRLRSYDDEETTERARSLRSLDAQLFVSRIAHFLLREQEGLPSETTLADARTAIENRIQSLLGVAGKPDAAAFAAVTVEEGGKDATEGLLGVSIQSPPNVLRESVRFQAQIRLG